MVPGWSRYRTCIWNREEKRKVPHYRTGTYFWGTPESCIGTWARCLSFAFGNKVCATNSGRRKDLYFTSVFFIKTESAVPSLFNKVCPFRQFKREPYLFNKQTSCVLRFSKKKFYLYLWISSDCNFPCRPSCHPSCRPSCRPSFRLSLNLSSSCRLHPPPLRARDPAKPGGYKEMSSIFADQERPRITSPNAGWRGGVAGSQPMNSVAGSQPINTAVHITWH